jgi:hypothetical protein
MEDQTQNLFVMIGYLALLILWGLYQGRKDGTTTMIWRRMRQVIIYPDSTGKRETSNARQSDLAILQGAGFTARAKESNPLQKDRVATVNSMCRAAAGGAVSMFGKRRK